MKTTNKRIKMIVEKTDTGFSAFSEDYPTLLTQIVQGRKKPSDAQTKKILLGIHQIGKELSEINLIHRP